MAHINYIVDKWTGETITNSGTKNCIEFATKYTNSMQFFSFEEKTLLSRRNIECAHDLLMNNYR